MSTASLHLSDETDGEIATDPRDIFAALRSLLVATRREDVLKKERLLRSLPQVDLSGCMSRAEEEETILREVEKIHNEKLRLDINDHQHNLNKCLNEGVSTNTAKSMRRIKPRAAWLR